MNLKLNKNMMQLEKISYAKEDAVHVEPEIDCSAGSNPFLMPEAAKKAIKETTISQVNHYPHFMGLKEAIISYFSDVAELKNSNIFLTSGSIDAIYAANYIFMGDGARVLGICPQFSDYMSHAKLIGYEYVPVMLSAENGYKVEAEEILDRLDESYSLVYIDNPHNPTGQVISLDILRSICKKAERLGVCVILDEAYGEFMDNINSGINLLKEFENILVFRTLSKGFGLAGLRAGYAVGSEYLVGMLDKLSNPYVISEPARRIAAAAMSDRAFIEDCKKKISDCKEVMVNAFNGNLSVAYTTNTVPISLILHRDENVDLAALLMERGVEVVSGGDFENLGRNGVRLRLPEPAQFDKLMKILKDIDEGK